MPNSLKNIALLLATGLNTASSRMPDFFTSQYPNPAMPDADKAGFEPMRRRLLHWDDEVSVTHPYPDHVAKMSEQVSYDMGQIFTGDYRMLWAYDLPEWLSPTYKTTSYDELYAEKVFVDEEDPNTAYVIDGNLHLLNISDLNNITEFSTYLTQGYSTNVFVYNRRAYLLADRLFILNVSNPYEPTQLSNFSIDANRSEYKFNSAFIMSAYDEIAYVKDAREVHVLDLSNPADPQTLGSYAFPYEDTGSSYGGIALSNDNLFVTHASGLHILNVRYPAQPQLKSIFPGRGYQGISLYGNRAYIASGPYGVDILDVYDKNNPKRIHNYPFFYRQAMAQNVVVCGSLAFISGNYLGLLQIVDFADPRNPRVILERPLSSIDGGRGLVFAGSRLLFSDGYSGLGIMELDKLSLTGTVRHTNSKEEVFPITVSALHDAGYAIKSDWFTLFVNEPPLIAGTIDEQSLFPDQAVTLPLNVKELLKAPDHNKLTFSLSLRNNNQLPYWLNLTQDVKWVGEFPQKMPTNNSDNHVGVNRLTVYTSFADVGLQMINLQDPSSPQAMGRLTSATCGLAISGDFAFSQNNGSLLLLSPHMYGEYPLGYQNSSCELAYASSRLYETDSQEVFIIDVNNFELLHRMSAANSALAVSENTLFLANQSGISIWDVSNASQPELLSTISTKGDPGKLHISQDLLFLGDRRSRRLNIFNVSDPRAPKWLSSFPVGKVSGIAVSKSQKTVFLAIGNLGLQALNIQNPSEPKLVFSYTNATHVDDVAVFSPETIVFVDQKKGLQIVNLSTNWKLQASPHAEDAGNYYLTLTATNEFGSSESIEFTMRVEGKPQMVANAVPARFPTTVGLPFFYSLMNAFTHPNHYLLDYQVKRAQNPSQDLGWLHFDPISGSIAGTPTDQDINEIIDLQMIATDPRGNKAFAWMNVSVEPKAIAGNEGQDRDSISNATWVLSYAGPALALIFIALAYKYRAKCSNAVHGLSCVRFFKPKVHPVPQEAQQADIELSSVHSNHSTQDEKTEKKRSGASSLYGFRYSAPGDRRPSQDGLFEDEGLNERRSSGSEVSV